MLGQHAGGFDRLPNRAAGGQADADHVLAFRHGIDDLDMDGFSHRLSGPF